MKTKATSRNRTRIAHRTNVAARGLGGAMIAGAVAGCFSTPALAGPEGQDVVHGTADFATDGTYTTITTSHIAIINYDAFNIGAGETVQFVQPGATSRVLNRINGAAPTEIHGNLLANGSVYFSNSAGVIFHQGSVVNVGNLYAAAGNISNANFLSNVNHFTDVQGSVVNRGTITSTGSVSLIGHSVQNFGTVVAEDSVTMVSGNDVLIGQRNGRVFARIEGAPPSNAGDGVNPAGVHHHGAVVSRNGQIYFGVGDAFAMAAYSGSSIQAPDVTIAGGANSTTEISGSIDASDHNAGMTGGNVTITGDMILLNGANIDASGHSGGGTVLVGGDVRGSGEMLKARGVYMTADTNISVDAIAFGNGGKAVLFASDSTYFGGNVTARGGAYAGDGGFVEVSGLENVFLKGSVNTLALNGKGGTLLIDPRDITIVASGAADVIAGDVTFADFMGSNDAAFNDGDIQALLGTNGTLMLEANRDIRFDNTSGNVIIDVPGEAGAFTSGNLSISAGRSITLDNGTVIDLGSTGVFDATFNSNSATEAVRNDGGIMAANFVMTGTAAITAGGGFVLNQGANSPASFLAGNVTLGAINAAAGDIATTGLSGDVTIANALVSGGVVSIATTGGDIIFNGVASSITANSDNPGNDTAGLISLVTTDADGEIRVSSGSNPTLEASGVGGRVSLAADELIIGDNSGGVEGLSILAGSNAGAPSTGGNVDVDIRVLTIRPDGDLQITTGAVANNFLGTVEFTPRSDMDIGTISGALLTLSADVLSNLSTENLVVTGSAGTSQIRFGGLNQAAAGNFDGITNFRISLTGTGSNIVGTNDTNTFDAGNFVLESGNNVTLNGQINSTGNGVSIYADNALNVNAVVNANTAVVAASAINFTGAETSVVFNVANATQILNDGEILISDFQAAAAGTLLLTESIMSRFVSTNGATQALQIGGTASIGNQTAITTGTITVNGVAAYNTTFAGAVNRGVTLTSAVVGSDIVFSGTNEFITLSALAVDQVNFTGGTTTVSGTNAGGAAFRVESLIGDINLNNATLTATNDEVTFDAGSNFIEIGSDGAIINAFGTAAGVNGINFVDAVRLDSETAPSGASLTLTSNSGIDASDINVGTGLLGATFSANDDAVARSATFGAVTAGSLEIAGTGGNDSLTVGQAAVSDVLNFFQLDSLTLGTSGASTADQIFIETDTLALNGTLSAATVDIIQSADGSGILLGIGADAANILVLSNAELANITTTGDLTIGDNLLSMSPRTVAITVDGVDAAAFSGVGGTLNLTANGLSGDVTFQNSASTLGDTIITAADSVSVATGGITMNAGSTLRFNAASVNVAAAIDGSAGTTSITFDTDSLALSANVAATESITFLSLSNEVIDIAGTVGGTDLDISAASLGFVTSDSLVFGDNDGDTTAVSIGSSIGTAFVGQNVSLFADGGATPSITIAPGAVLGFGSLLASTDGTITVNSANAITAVSSLRLDAPTINSNGSRYTVTGASGAMEIGRAGGVTNLQAANNTFGSTGANGLVTFRGSFASAGNSMTLDGGRLTISAGGTINLGAGDFNITGPTIALGETVDVANSMANTQVVQPTLDVLTANNVNIGNTATTRVDNFGVRLDGTGAMQTITGITTYTTNGASATDGTHFSGTFVNAAAANTFTGLVVASSNGEGLGNGGVFVNSNINAINAGVDVDAGNAGIVFGGGAITATGTSQNVNLNAGNVGNSGTLITSTAGNAITVNATGQVVFQDDANSMTGITVGIDTANASAVMGSSFEGLSATNAIAITSGTLAADQILVNGNVLGQSINVTGGTNTFNGSLTSTGGGITLAGTSTFNAGGNVINATGGTVFVSGGLATFTGKLDYSVVTSGQGVIFFNGLALNGPGNATFDMTNAGAVATGGGLLVSSGLTSNNATDITISAGSGGIINLTNGSIGTAMAQLGDINVLSAGSLQITTVNTFANSLTLDGTGTFVQGNGTSASTITLSGANGAGFGLEITSSGQNTISNFATINSTSSAIAINGTTNLGGSILTNGAAITFGAGGMNGDIVLQPGTVPQIRTANAGVIVGGANIVVNGNITQTGTLSDIIVAAGANTFTVTGGIGAMGAGVGDVLLTGAAQIGGAVFADSFVMDGAAANADTDFGGTVTLTGNNGSGDAFIARGNQITVGAIDASTASGGIALLANGAGSLIQLGGDITTNNQGVSIQAITTSVTSGADLAINAGTADFTLLGGGMPSTFDTMGQNVTITSNTPDFAATLSVIDSMGVMGDTFTFLGATGTTNFFLGDGAGGTAGTDALIDTITLQSIAASVDGVVFGTNGPVRNITASNALMLTDITLNVGTGVFNVNGTFGTSTAAAAAAITVNGRTNLDATVANAILQGNGGAVTLNGALNFNNAANAASLLSNGGAIAVNGDVSVGAGGTSTINSIDAADMLAAGSINITGEINGTANAGTLVVSSNAATQADAAITVGGNVGDTNSLSSISLDAGDSNITLSGTSFVADAQSYTAAQYMLMPTAVGSPIAFTSNNAGAISFNGGAIGVGAGSDLSVINANGDVTLAGLNFADAGRTLTATATGSTLTVAGIGSGGMVLETVNMTAEEMQVGGNMFANNINLTSVGNIVLGSATNAAGAPNELTTAELDFINAGPAQVTIRSTGGSITTNTNNYNYVNNLNLLASTAVNLDAAWNFFGSVFAEGAVINVNANQVSTLASAGAMQSNAFLLGTGFIVPFGEANTVNLNASITANGSVSIGGVNTITIVNGMQAVDTSMGNGSILICGPIQAANAMSTLTLNSGDMGVGNGLTVGSMTGFDTITLMSAGAINFKGANYTSTGNQTYTANDFLLSSVSQAMVFDAQASNVTFNNGNIAQANGFNNQLTMSGSTLNVNNVTTSFDQTYNGSLKLSGHLVTTGQVGGGDALRGEVAPPNGTSITVNGNTMLLTNASATTANDANNNDGVAFVGTIDGMTNTLTVTSSGNILYAGNINNVSMFTSSAVGNDINFVLDTVNADAQSYTAATYTTFGTGAMPTLTFSGNGIAFNGGAIQAPNAATTLIFNGGTGTASLVGIDGVMGGRVTDLQVRGTDVNLAGAINASQVLFGHSNAAGVINVGSGMGYLLSQAELQLIATSAVNPVTLIVGEAMNQVNLGSAVALNNMTHGIYRVAGAAYNGASDFSTSGAAIELTSAATTLNGGTHASMGGAISASGANLALTGTTLNATNMAGNGGAINIAAATTVNGAVNILGNSAVTLGATNGQMAGAGDLTVTGNAINLAGNSLGATSSVNSVVLNSNTAVNLLTVNTATSQTYNTIINLLDTANLTNTAGAMAFNQAVTLAGAVAMNNAGTVTFANSINGTVPSTLAINVTGNDAVSFQQIGTAGTRFTDLVVTNGVSTFNQDVFLSGMLDVDNATSGAVRNYIFDIATLVWDGTVDFGTSQNVNFTLGSANFGTGGTVAFGNGNLTINDNANVGAGVTFSGDATMGTGNSTITSDAGLMFAGDLNHGAGRFTSTSTAANFMGDVVVTGNNQTAFDIGTGQSGGTIAFGGDVGAAAARLQSLVVNTTGELQFTNVASQSVNLVSGLNIDGLASSAAAVRTFGQTTIDTSLDAAAGSIVITANLLGSGGANDGFTFIVDRTSGALIGSGAFGGTIDREVPVIRINGNVGSANAANALTDLRFNTNGGAINGRDFVPANATVVFGNPNTFGNAANPTGTGHTVMLDGQFVMGQNEKLVVLGSLAVSAATATVGDMIAIGTLDFGGITGDTFFLTREPGVLLPADSQIPVTDLGVDIIANQLIFNLRGSASTFVLGTGNSPIFADSDAFVVGAEGFGLTIAQFNGNLSEQVVTLDSSRTVLDTLFSGTSRENVSEAIAGAVPREAQSGDVGNDTSAGTARREELIQIGIFPKRTVQEFLDAGQPEQAAQLMGDILDALRGRSLYDDTLDIANAANVDGVTDMRRLQFDIVLNVLDAYKALVISETVNPATGEVEITYLNNDIETALFNAMDDYFASIPDDQDFTVDSFAAFLENSADHIDATGYLVQIKDLITQIQILGLTNFELINVYNNVLNPVLPEDFRTELNQYLGLQGS